MKIKTTQMFKKKHGTKLYRTTFDDFRASAHKLGRFLGLTHTDVGRVKSSFCFAAQMAQSLRRKK